MLALFTGLTGFVYPVATTLLARLAFPYQSSGSILASGNHAVGSELLAQAFSDPQWFWPRPSSCDYNAAASSGSNLGPTNDSLTSVANARVRVLRDADPDNRSAVPVDLVTASGSGLDPHISPAAALYQIPRVARTRGLPEALVRELVLRHIEQRTGLVLGEPRVNVLRLNIALDAVIAKGHGKR